LSRVVATRNAAAMKALLAVLLLVLAHPPVLAEPSASRSTTSAELTYSGYIAGFNVFDVKAGVELSPDGYQLGLGFRTVGVVGAVIHSDMLAFSQGVWRPNTVVPQRYLSAGLWRGDQRSADIEYPDGNPHIERLIPHDDTPRDPIPEAMTHHTADALSAIAFLVNTVATTGGCDGHINTFDGRRLNSVTSHTAGTETLPIESRSFYAGPALRCDLEGRQIAGFPLDAGPDDMLRHTNHSSVWLAPAQPGMPPVPVLMSFEVRLLGHLTLYVTGIRKSAELAHRVPLMP